MERILAFSDTSEAREILRILTTWSENGFINPLYVALGNDDPTSGPLEIVRLTPTGLTHLNLNQTIGTLKDIPMVIQVCLGRLNSGTKLGKRTANEIQQSILRFADANQRLQKAAILATDSPVTPLDLDVDDTPSAKFFLVPEDRTRPGSPIGHLSEEYFASHVAAGVVSLCGLWTQHSDVEPAPNVESPIDQALSEGQQGSHDMIFLYRSFVRILQLPTLVSRMVQEAGVEFGQHEYPNPDQIKFERSSLAPYIASIADTYVSTFPEVQAGEPALLPQLSQGKTKVSLFRAIREQLDLILQQLALKPAEFADSVLGSYYDHLARRVENLIPNGNVEVLRWRELGESGKESSKISEEISQTIDRLPESDVSSAWIAYRELALGLLDGQENDGTKLVANQMFISSADRQVITPFPEEVVLDPLVELGITRDESECEEESRENQKPTSADDESRPIDFAILNLTQAIRQRIESAVAASASRVEEIHAAHFNDASTEMEEGNAPQNSEARQIDRKISRSVRGTFAGIAISLALSAFGVFFTHYALQGWTSYLTVASIVCAPILLAALSLRALYVGGSMGIIIVALVVASNLFHAGFHLYLIILGCIVLFLGPGLLVLSIWKSARIRSKYTQQKMEVARVRVNEVLEVAHHLSAIKRLNRRLSEFDDWSAVVGLVAHHPFEFDVIQSSPHTEVEFRFPRSVLFGTGRVSENHMEQLIGNFRRELIPVGWLNQRFSELRRDVLVFIRTKVGSSRELNSAQIEGNTSTDKDSARKLFFGALSEILHTQGANPLISRLATSMEGISVSDFCDEVSFRLPDGSSEQVDSLDFLQNDLLEEGYLLHSHWKPGGRVERSKVISNYRFGNASQLLLNSDSVLRPPTVIVGTVQMTSRISPDTLSAFPKAK